MTNFDLSFNELLSREGGYVNDPELFLLRFTNEKFKHYLKICEKNTSQRKFYGWVRRAVS